MKREFIAKAIANAKKAASQPRQASWKDGGWLKN